MSAPGFDHALTLRSPTAAVTDSEGRTTYQYVTTQFMGRVAMLNFAEHERAAVASQQYDAVVLVPHGVTVPLGAQMFVEDIDPLLDGTYEVASVRYTVPHQRVFCRRWA